MRLSIPPHPGIHLSVALISEVRDLMAFLQDRIDRDLRGIVFSKREIHETGARSVPILRKIIDLHLHAEPAMQSKSESRILLDPETVGDLRQAHMMIGTPLSLPFFHVKKEWWRVQFACIARIEDALRVLERVLRLQRAAGGEISNAGSMKVVTYVDRAVLRA